LYISAKERSYGRCKEWTLCQRLKHGPGGAGHFEGQYFTASQSEDEDEEFRDEDDFHDEQGFQEEDSKEKESYQNKDEGSRGEAFAAQAGSSEVWTKKSLPCQISY
jgi:hypothetical protein